MPITVLGLLTYTTSPNSHKFVEMAIIVTAAIYMENPRCQQEKQLPRVTELRCREVRT